MTLERFLTLPGRQLLALALSTAITLTGFGGCCWLATAHDVPVASVTFSK